MEIIRDLMPFALAFGYIFIVFCGLITIAYPAFIPIPSSNTFIRLIIYSLLVIPSFFFIFWGYSEIKISRHLNGKIFIKFFLGIIPIAILITTIVRYSFFLSDCNVSERIVPNAVLSSCNFSGKDLSNSNLTNANLRFTDLSNANLQHANLTSVNLASSSLEKANLQYADLTGADLSSAALDGANLQYANLTGANLDHASLSYADLTNATLDKVILSTTRFQHSIGLTDEVLARALNVPVQQVPMKAFEQKIRLEYIGEIYSQLSTVCSGNIIPNAIPYTPDTNNLVVFFDKDMKPIKYSNQVYVYFEAGVEYSSKVYFDFAQILLPIPAAARHSQIVVCLSEEEIEVGTCNYDFGELKKYEMRIHGQLIETRTGNTLSKFTLYPKKSCPASIEYEVGHRPTSLVVSADYKDVESELLQTINNLNNK